MLAVTIVDVRRGVWIGHLGRQEAKCSNKEAEPSRAPYTRKCHLDPRGVTVPDIPKLQSQRTGDQSSSFKE